MSWTPTGSNRRLDRLPATARSTAAITHDAAIPARSEGQMETRERRARRQSGIPALLRSFLLADCVPLVAEQAFQGRGSY